MCSFIVRVYVLVNMHVIISSIYVEHLVWSKLDSGRLPSLNEVMSMVTDHMPGNNDALFGG